MAEVGVEGRGEEPVTPPPQEAGAQAVDDRRLLRSQYLAVKNLISGRGEDRFSSCGETRIWF